MTWGARLRDERGFTLIELIVASAIGLLVCGAAFAILAVSYKLLRNDSDRVDANQQGRTAMLKIEQLLNSSCVDGLGVSTVLGGSTAGTGAPPSGANSITFVASRSDNPTTPPSEYQVYLNSANQLDLATYPGTGPEPNTTFPTTPPTTETLISHAALVPITSGIFSYYPYLSSGALSTSPSGVTPYLGATSAAAVAGIGIQFEAQPSDGVTVSGGSADFASQVVLRLTPVSTSTLSSTPAPCS
jgi:prepilin-type N-terminal cleavage/methylation domain-containing protein